MINSDAIDLLSFTESTIETTTQTLLTWQILVTIILSVSLKAMWNLLHVMQILTFSKNFTEWPALATESLTYINDAIYLEEISGKVLEFGQSKFDLAKIATHDKFSI